MEFTSWEQQLIENARTSPGDARKRVRLVVVCFVMIVIGVACAISADFTPSRVITGLLIVGFYGTLVEHLRFKSRTVLLLNKITSNS